MNASRRLADLWYSSNECAWQAALGKYWNGGFIKESNLEVEHEMDALDSDSLLMTSDREWYDFLHNKYFPWKYTAANRLTTTTGALEKYIEAGTLPELGLIKRALFAFDKEDIRLGLSIAMRVRGLGAAGASGLLAVLFPEHFGTVDQFAVKALLRVPGLPQRAALTDMKRHVCA